MIQSSVVGRQSSDSVAGRWALAVGRILLVLAVGFGSTASFAQHKTLVLKGGKLLTISHGEIENGVLVISAGKIAAIGAANAVKVPKDAQVIDVTGMTVYPGLIDSESYLGLTEISAEGSTNDLIETSDEIMPHMHVYDAFHAESELIPVARLNGITNAIVAPQSQDTLPGQDSFIQLDGRSANDMLLVRDIATPRTLPESSGGTSPGKRENFREPAWAWRRNCARPSRTRRTIPSAGPTTKGKSPIRPQRATTGRARQLHPSTI